MNSPESLVAQIHGLSSTAADLSQLHETLKKSEELLRAQSSRFLLFLTELDPANHSLGYLFLLANKPQIQERTSLKKQQVFFAKKLNMDKSEIYGDGVAWLRGAMIGKGSFGCVYLATLKNPKSRYSYFPSVMAVKSAEVSVSGSIQKEGEVLNNVKGCSSIIQCYGEGKLEPYFRGTPLYLSPEAVLDCIQEGPADVWALGCIVLEMLTGKPPWVGEENLDAAKILKRIGEGNELPKIPSGLSEDAQGFLKGCFVRNPMYRLTADMLLNHPFVEGLVDDDDGPEEFPVVEDVLGVESILFVAESDDDILYSDSSLSAYSEYASDGDDSYCYSDDDAEDSEEDIESTFSEEEVTKEGILNITDSRSDAKADHTAKSTSTVPLPGNTSSTPQYPVNLTIRAGV